MLVQGGILKENEDKVQGRLYIPLVKEWTGAPTCTYTITHMNKTVDIDKIKHIFMLLVLPTESVFKH
jgi:hypothetical protein